MNPNACLSNFILQAGTCFRLAAAQSAGSSGGGYGSATNDGSSHVSGTNENEGSGTVGGIGRVLGRLGLSSRSSQTADTTGHNSAQGGGSGTSNTN